MAVDVAERTPEQLREQTLSWLRENLPAGWMEAVDAGDDEAFARVRQQLDYDEWCVRLGEAGYATPTWPSEYGAGLSLTPGQARHVNEVLGHYKVPRPFNIIGIGMGGPTVMAWGTEELKHRLLRGIATNQEIWCQLFSEPGAGSDVAGLSTRAVRDGDEWVVNGQKVWTTLGHVARYGMLVARTNPDLPKHQGLTYFIVDMHAPGVE
ncbi:MAG: acyl-CoA dehydrogenase family protein, partial [Actinobacteria bacterium]|nr:acyl-CoA dehydrogenase family protein [Actinomycetota bacterium]